MLASPGQLARIRITARKKGVSKVDIENECLKLSGQPHPYKLNVVQARFLIRWIEKEAEANR